MSQAQPVRFPILTPEEMSPRQKEVAAAIADGPRGGIRGPFLALIHNPELANCVQQLGEHLRFGNKLSLAQSELVVLTVCARAHCAYNDRSGRWHHQSTCAGANTAQHDD